MLQNVWKIYCNYMGYENNVYASLVFCSSEELRIINKKYRGLDSFTDVISFPSETIEEVIITKKGQDLYLGEILIDIDNIKIDNSLNINDSLTRVFIHGLLHLSGFDHINTKQKEVMKKTEDTILNFYKGRIK